jgi:hypothetical protein
MRRTSVFPLAAAEPEENPEDSQDEPDLTESA